jgi:hypothetical protein
MQIPFPKNLRALFRAFSLYDPATGLDSFIQKIDFDTVQSRQIYYSVHNRLPESAMMAEGTSDYHSKDHFRSALNSQEFQDNILQSFLNAFPERRRLIFIHVPKCAGTHLYARLRSKFPSLATSLSDQSWTSKSALFESLHALARYGNFFDEIFIYGHVPLSWYTRHSLLRPTDHLFSVIRDPSDLLVSRANHVVTRILEEPDLSSPDTRLWATQLGINQHEFDASPGALVDLGTRILHDQRFVQKNWLCQYFGDGTFASALDTIIRTDIEITDVTTYNTWFEGRWGLRLGEKENVSRQILSKDNLSSADRNYLVNMTTDDRKLYDVISLSLSASPLPSVFGRELALHRRGVSSSDGT